jgi:hypothetical protein
MILQVAAKERQNTVKHMVMYPEFYEKRLQQSQSSKKIREWTSSSSSSSYNLIKSLSDLTDIRPGRRSSTAPTSLSYQDNLPTLFTRNNEGRNSHTSYGSRPSLC